MQIQSLKIFTTNVTFGLLSPCLLSCHPFCLFSQLLAASFSSCLPNTFPPSLQSFLPTCVLSFVTGRPLLHAWLFSDLNTPREIILFSSVVMVLAFGVRGPWFEFHPNHISLPCICSFVSLFRTLFVRGRFVRDRPPSHQSHLMYKKMDFLPNEAVCHQ